MYPVQKLKFISDRLSTLLTPSEDKITSVLVPKVTHAGKDHRHAMFIGGCYNLVVTHRTTGLNHTADTSCRCIINSVAEGEECI